jgi:hypothetical protein
MHLLCAQHLALCIGVTMIMGTRIIEGIKGYNEHKKIPPLGEFLR